MEFQYDKFQFVKLFYHYCFVFLFMTFPLYNNVMKSFFHVIEVFPSLLKSSFLCHIIRIYLCLCDDVEINIIYFFLYE